jgi:hypothetical protein
MTTMASLHFPSIESRWRDVPVDELKRLLEVPAPAVLDESTLETIREVEAWCAENVRIRHAVGRVEVESCEAQTLFLAEGRRLRTSKSFANRARNAKAESILIFALTLGEAVTERECFLWKEDRYDEACILHALGVAQIENVRGRFSDELCAWAAKHDKSVVACDAPGYRDWPLEELHTCSSLLERTSEAWESLGMRVNSSGMIQPAKSVIVVFALSRGAFGLNHRLAENPCTGCGFGDCRYRRRGAVKMQEAEFKT